MFLKRKEDFICEHCGAAIKGDGYTNHCQTCLWSKHVDIEPGDRAAECFGLMQPVAVTKKNGRYTIIHRCLKCGLEKPNKFQKQDSFEALLKVSAG